MARIPDKEGLHFDRPLSIRDTKPSDMKPVLPAHDHGELPKSKSGRKGRASVSGNKSGSAKRGGRK